MKNIRGAWRTLVVAVLVCLADGVAHAQSGVTIFGIIDAAAEYASDGNGTSIKRLRSGQASASRLGFRGVEDLGGGLRADFWLESAINVDDGTTAAAFWTRRSTVGLSGPWGRIDLGRQYRPEARAVFGMDVYDASSVASPANTYSQTTFRTDNAIVYETPNFNGLVGRAMVAAGEGVTGRDLGASLQYSRGPLYLAYGWDSKRNNANTDSRVWNSFGGAYDFGAAKLYAAYRTRKEAAAGLDEASYWLGASVPVASLVTLSAVVGVVNDKNPADKDARGFGLGADYDFSKRTTAYARYGKVTNRNGAAFNLDNGINGRSPRSLNVGLRHKF